jgi:hypothetical protein
LPLFSGRFAGIEQLAAAGVAVLPVYDEYNGTAGAAAQIDPSSRHVPVCSGTAICLGRDSFERMLLSLYKASIA